MKDETRIISVTFEGNAQRYKDGRFTIPKPVRDILQLEGRAFQLELLDASSEPVYKGTHQMKSGPEVYDLSEHVKRGEPIRVRVTRLGE